MQQKAKPKARTRKESEPTYKGAAKKKTSGILPKTDNQGKLIKAITESSQVIVFGPAGTGKTYVTATLASDMYLTKDIEKIVITRPMVSVGKDIGILPGELLDKVAPWALPVLDILIKHLGKASVEIALKSGNIEIAPLALMRGRSFDDAFIICDEAQNITTAELKMLLTRVGEGTTIVLNGDVQQTDLKGDSGLITITNVAKKHNLPVPIVEFGLDDIVRSDICAMWVRAFYEEKI
jgi:phosphate starvation-inducible PhoH-like protein|tara:strand:- start:25775 stop:26485 length:711 start_codon:yes stop_codon:yes gene_type:complete